MLLGDWMSADATRTQTWVGQMLGITQSAVGQWLADASRPTHALRGLLETLTKGEVPATSWETAAERRERETVEQRIARAS